MTAGQPQLFCIVRARICYLALRHLLQLGHVYVRMLLSQLPQNFYVLLPMGFEEVNFFLNSILWIITCECDLKNERDASNLLLK